MRVIGCEDLVAAHAVVLGVGVDASLQVVCKGGRSALGPYGTRTIFVIEAHDA